MGSLRWNEKSFNAQHAAYIRRKNCAAGDKIAYINHDIDDSVRAKVLREEDLPKEFTEVLGTTYRERINTMVLDIVKHSENLNDIVMSKEEEMQ